MISQPHAGSSPIGFFMINIRNNTGSSKYIKVYEVWGNFPPENVRIYYTTFQDESQTHFELWVKPLSVWAGMFFNVLAEMQHNQAVLRDDIITLNSFIQSEVETPKLPYYVSAAILPTITTTSLNNDAMQVTENQVKMGGYNENPVILLFGGLRKAERRAA